MFKVKSFMYTIKSKGPNLARLLEEQGRHKADFVDFAVTNHTYVYFYLLMFTFICYELPPSHPQLDAPKIYF